MQNIVKYASCRRTVLSVIAASWAVFATADDRLALERTASIFHSYEFTPVVDTPPPEGFVRREGRTLVIRVRQASLAGLLAERS